MLTLTRQNQQLPFIWILSRITTGQCTKKNQQQQGQPRGPSNYMYIQCTNSTHMHFQQNTLKKCRMLWRTQSLIWKPDWNQDFCPLIPLLISWLKFIILIYPTTKKGKLLCSIIIYITSVWIRLAQRSHLHTTKLWNWRRNPYMDWKLSY